LAEVQVDIEGPHPLEEGDVFVLCSDGLCGPVSDREIGAAVTALAPDEACRFLIDLANLHGGPDNITAIVVRVSAPDQPADGHRGSSVTRGLMPLGSLRWSGRGLPDLWPPGALVLGILLGIGAIALTFAELPGSIAVFLLATLAVIAGLGGLFMQNLRLKNEVVEDEPRRLQVYRQTSCAIELPMVVQLAKAQAQLMGRIRDNGWDADWTSFEHHQELARHFQSEGDLVQAFREYCRATSLLAEVVQRQRGKEENFQAVWDPNKN
jgi:protein phosphatase